MKRKHPTIFRQPFWLILIFISGCFCSYSYAADTDTTSIEERAKQISQSATSVFNNALETKKAISRFTHKQAISDSSTQMAVYVSFNTTTDKRPTKVSIEIKLDGNTLTRKEYQGNALKALINGATHKLYLGNIPRGNHDLIAHIKEHSGKSYVDSHGAIRFDKGSQRKILELSVSLSDQKLPPEIVFLDHS